MGSSTFVPVFNDEIQDGTSAVPEGVQVDGDQGLVDRQKSGGDWDVRNAAEGPGSEFNKSTIWSEAGRRQKMIGGTQCCDDSDFKKLSQICQVLGYLIA